MQFGIDVSRDKRLWWKGGQPYNAPAVQRGDYLLQMHWKAVDGSQQDDAALAKANSENLQ